MRDISITFGNVQALSEVSLRLHPGEVHALMGENGAGKSTLIKALTGVYTIDSGTVLVGGEEHEFSSPAASQAAGISTVYQEVNLLPNLTVAENMLLGPRAPPLRRHQRPGDEPPRPGDAREPRHRHRPHLRPRRAPDRDPAAGRHRPRRRRRGAGADPRRAHLQPGRRRGGQAVRGDAPAARPGRRDRLRLALPRPGLRDRRPDDDPAQRQAGRGADGRRDQPARAGQADDRPRARGPRAPRPRGQRARPPTSRARPCSRRSAWAARARSRRPTSSSTRAR